ncbi:hypothetical protein FIBSPDRAFT_1040045 [Athelia psychrophila]|uniref:Uncharacterized protein n=1 Tax=Athelia psychrophila TaxID=1759441 RepID=A0A166R216_9AGAM|nr:hypothetical protein FIBSPDRAFT_1040045 [Fibularhizoctonia sp. CBS 109695]
MRQGYLNLLLSSSPQPDNMDQSYKTFHTSGGNVINSIVNGGVCNIHNQVNHTHTYHGVAPAVPSNPNPANAHAQAPEAPSEAGASRTSGQQGSGTHGSGRLMIEGGPARRPIRPVATSRVFSRVQ